jgi:GNAT superfamily N-acetyltransferase
MHDMLVRLYALPDPGEALAACAAQGVAIRRALMPEKHAVLDWVRAQFPSALAEVEAAFAHPQVRCFVALRAGRLAGFACHDVTCPNYFGPEGVAADLRGRGIGRALLLATLHAQRADGFAYAIIGGVGPAAFYAKAAGAVDIAGSTPGMYGAMLGARGG